MFVKYKKDYEKILMGFLSYLDDFKTLENLQQEMLLYQNSTEFPVYLYRPQNEDFKAIVSCQALTQAMIVRYISMAPDFRSDENCVEILHELQENLPDKKLMFSPDNIELGELFEKKYG